VCRSRSLGSKANTPQGDDEDDDEETDQDKIISTEGESSSAKRITSGKSDYSRIREANIAQNKELLRQLGLDHVGFKLRGTDKKNEKKATAASSSGSRTVDVVGHMKSDTLTATTSATTSEITATSSATTSEITATLGDSLQSDTSANGTKTPEPQQAQDLMIPASDLSIMRNDTSANSAVISEFQEPDQAPDLTTLVSTIANDSVTTDIDAPSFACASEPTSIPEPDQALDLTTLVSTITNDSVTTDIDAPSSACASEPTSIPEPNQALDLTTLASTITNDLATMDIDAPSSASASEPSSIPYPIEVDQEKGEEITREVDHEKGEEARTPSTANVAMIAPPAWLTTLKMDVYLQECSNAKEWQGLVQSLYKFENGNSINGVCVTT